MIRSKTSTLVVPVLGTLRPQSPSLDTSVAAVLKVRRASRRPPPHPTHVRPAAEQPTRSREGSPSGPRRADPDAAVQVHRRRRPALVGLGAIGVALVVAGCGSAASTPSQTPLAPAAMTVTAAPAKSPATVAQGAQGPYGAAPAPAKSSGPATPSAVKAPTTPTPTPTPSTASRPVAGVPQGNGGDGDPDNSGGPDDGDGGI
jgi:hypothetical protein